MQIQPFVLIQAISGAIIYQYIYYYKSKREAQRKSTGDCRALDCANYDLPHQDVDQYRIFVEKCSGSKELGFRNRAVFHARFLQEAEFNKLFEKVRTTNFEIRIEDTSFKRIGMPLLTRAKRPKSKRNRLFVIRYNNYLKKVIIPKFAFDVQETFHVEIDGNPTLDTDVVERFNANCVLGMGKKCDAFLAERKLTSVF
ncbi:unnamed protein product [Strongylus vulgaris]|uniref:Uncharacterized protein n=1 Tax=Strongylus vulgaris TaxID=40348 RepID=A0A3P7KRZ7_STRVU|nr:unnamed protein product [Strongylus vulgaris]